ncbi:hypothetical protein HDR58_09785 [bacterium]|nr:hypothetical protein [bacterium]
MGNDLLVNFGMPQSKLSFGTGKVENYFEKCNRKFEEEKARQEAEKARKEAEKQAKQQFEQRTKAITSIIEEDPNVPKTVNKTELALAIIKNAQIVGVDPLLLACICKKESHFNQTLGNGLTQVTSIVTQDMYQRAGLFDEHLNKLISQYKSLDNVFAAKNANPKLDLGDFGEMLYKYRTPAKLFQALQKDSDLNLRCGAYTIRFQLNQHNGNVRTALEEYNTTANKKSYANKIIGYMENAKALVRLNVYY